MENPATTTVSGALHAAAEHHAAGRLDEAERLCDAVLAALPEHAEALHRRGVLAFQRGALGHAGDLVRRAVAADPRAPELRNSLGNILHADGDYAGAIECYRAALSLGPDDPTTMINLGVALYGAGGRAEAKEMLTGGLDAMPDHAQARAALATIALDEGEDADALTQLRAAAFLDQRFGYGASCVLGDDLEAYTDTSGIEEMLAAAPVVEGDMPGPTGSAPVVVTACDFRYFRRFGRTLATSLDVNAPGQDLHFHVFNPDAEFTREFDALRASLANTTLTASHEFAPAANPVYFSNMRLVRLHQIMVGCGRGLVCLDADSLVRGPFDALGDMAEMSATLRTEKAEIGQKWLATTLLFRDTERVRGYLERVASYVLNCYHEDRLVWYLDQCVLFLVHRMMHHGGEAPELVPLPSAYADTALAAESVIWAAKGDRKMAPAFVAEAARYALPTMPPGKGLRLSS